MYVEHRYQISIMQRPNKTRQCPQIGRQDGINAIHAIEKYYIFIYLSFIALCIVNGVEYILQKELNSGLTIDIEEGRFRTKTV